MTKLPLSVLLICALLPACGAVCNNSTAEISVAAPSGTIVSVDGLPTASGGGLIRVSNHHDHVISGKRPDGTQASCAITAEIQPRYVVGDIILFETLIPLLLDGVTADWESIPEESRACAL